MKNLPSFALKCDTCSAGTRVLRDSIHDLAEHLPRCVCGGIFQRAATGPSTQVMERLDNGAMPRAVERLADAERLYADRAKSADPLSGTNTRS